MVDNKMKIKKKAEMCVSVCVAVQMSDKWANSNHSKWKDFRFDREKRTKQKMKEAKKRTQKHLNIENGEAATQ